MPLANKSLKEIAAGERKTRRLILAAMVFVMGSLLFSFFFGEMGLMHFNKMKAARFLAQREIKALQRENNRLLYEIEALKSNPLYIELLARDRLGFSKQGDLTYEFYNAQGAAPLAEPPPR